MTESLIVLVTALASIMASSGFWMFLQGRRDKKDARTKMLLGLGHDRLLYLCMLFIDRGEVSQDEFENIMEYLYTPYKELGGNGTITKLMDRVSSLPIRTFRNQEPKGETK